MADKGAFAKGRMRQALVQFGGLPCVMGTAASLLGLAGMSLGSLVGCSWLAVADYGEFGPLFRRNPMEYRIRLGAHNPIGPFHPNKGAGAKCGMMKFC
jgi:hypothetical protein